MLFKNLSFTFYVSVIIISILLIKLNIPSNVWFCILIAILLSYYFITTKDITKHTDNDDMKKKLDDLLDKNDSLLNPSLVKIFVKLYPYSRFNPDCFSKALIGSNQLCRLYESVKVGNSNINHIIDITEELQRNILNNLESISHSFPVSINSHDKFKAYIKILHKLLEKMNDDIKKIYQYKYDKSGPDIHNPPPTTRGHPWSNPDNNDTWSFYH